MLVVIPPTTKQSQIHWPTEPPPQLDDIFVSPLDDLARYAYLSVILYFDKSYYHAFVTIAIFATVISCPPFSVAGASASSG